MQTLCTPAKAREVGYPLAIIPCEPNDSLSNRLAENNNNHLEKIVNDKIRNILFCPVFTGEN